MKTSFEEYAEREYSRIQERERRTEKIEKVADRVWRITILAWAVLFILGQAIPALVMVGISVVAGLVATWCSTLLMGMMEGRSESLYKNYLEELKNARKS